MRGNEPDVHFMFIPAVAVLKLGEMRKDDDPNSVHLMPAYVVWRGRTVCKEAPLIMSSWSDLRAAKSF